VTPERLIELMGLKALDRTGWVRKGVPGPESVAAHSWGVGLLVLLLLPEDLDRERALAYAVLHDLAEVRTGDLTPSDGVAPTEKALRERDAIHDLLQTRPDLIQIWEAYEAQDHPEARFVRQLDRLDMAIQAVAYTRLGSPDLTEFLDSADAVVQHPLLRPILDALRADLTIVQP